MTNKDMSYIHKFFVQEEARIYNLLGSVENSYLIFHRYDEFDFLELLTLKLQQSYMNDLEKCLLALCSYLCDIDERNLK